MPKKSKPSLFKKELEVTWDKKRKLVLGMKAHWFLSTEYNTSFSALSEINGENTSSLVVLAYCIHALLITGDSELTLDGVFDIIDSVGIEAISADLQELLK